MAIEGSSLSLSQVSAILEGKRVLGKPKELQEVKNAIASYERLSKLNPALLDSLLSAHKIMMKGLVLKAGHFRSGAVGILKGTKVSHVAPKAAMVPELVGQLLGYLKKSKDLALIKSCVFHYEFEFIHPFDDGNGRMGRLWQTLILAKFNPIFEYIPVESQVHAHLAEYYRVLEACDKKGDSTEFIEWMLRIILRALKQFASVCLPEESETFETRIEVARKEFGAQKFTRANYLKLLKTISAPTASRDLARTLESFRQYIGYFGYVFSHSLFRRRPLDCIKRARLPDAHE